MLFVMPSIIWYMVIWKKERSDGTCGIVIRQNAESPTRPCIRIVEQNETGDWIGKEEKDLTEELTVFILDTIED